MPAPSSDKEKDTYTVDEMMSRLRDGKKTEAEEGDRELVTREDGSQAIKVRKRKRRSKQEKVEKAKREKRWSLVKAVSVIAIPLLAGISVLLLLAYYHSGSYLTKVSAGISQATGSNVRLDRLSPLIFELRSPSMLLAWPDGSTLDQLRVTEIESRLDILPSLSGKISGDDLTAQSGYLISSRRDDRKVSVPGQKGGVLPTFDRFSCNQFAFFFGGMKSAFRLEETSVSFLAKNEVAYLSLNGGSLVAPGWGSLPLQRGSIEIANETIELTALRFKSPEQTVMLSGELNLANESQKLKVEVSQGTFSTFAGESLGRLFDGPLTGATGELNFESWDVNSHQVSLSVQPDYLAAKNFEFLGSLEKLYGEAAFANFEFQPTVPFQLNRGPGYVEVRDFQSIAIGTLGLRGDFRVEGKALTGKMWVGLPDHRKLLIGQGNKAAFFANGTLEDGFFWFEVNLSGSTDSPKDNFWSYVQQEAAVDSRNVFDQLTQ